MERRDSVYVAIQHLTTVYNQRVQELKTDKKLNAEQRLAAELALERTIIAGLSEIETHLSLSGAFEENKEAQ